MAVAQNLTNTPGVMADPRLDIVGQADLHGLAPATVITAEIDSLRSEGQELAAKLKAAGVQVDAPTCDGVTHEVFGMGQVVGDQAGRRGGDRRPEQGVRDQ